MEKQVRRAERAAVEHLPMMDLMNFPLRRLAKGIGSLLLGKSQLHTPHRISSSSGLPFVPSQARKPLLGWIVASMPTQPWSMCH